MIKKSRFRFFFPEICFLLFLASLALSLAGPRWGRQNVAEYRRGLDVILALDLSRSMYVRDCPPPAGQSRPVSRLERALAAGRALTAALPEIRFGIALGQGRGVLALPLTWDREAVLTFLDSLDRPLITGGGTNLESLVDAAREGFKVNFPTRRAIVIFSDGEAHMGSLDAALERALEEGISLSILALGSEEGGPVPLVPLEIAGTTGKKEEAGDFLLDEEGEPVISRRRGALLRKAAEKTGGFYADGGEDKAPALLAEYLRSLASLAHSSFQRRESRPRWALFLGSAIVFLALSRLAGLELRSGPGKKPAAKKAARRAALLGVLLLISPLFNSCEAVQGMFLVMEGNYLSRRSRHTEAITSYLKALEYPGAAPYAEYGLGSLYLSLNETSAALERFEAAEKSLNQAGKENPELLFRLYYNAGIAYFEKEGFDQAAASFRRALEIDGGRIEAKRNLELSLLSVSRPETSSAAPPSREKAGHEGGEAGIAVLFEYLRQKDRDRWKSREWKTGSDSGPDY